MPRFQQEFLIGSQEEQQGVMKGLQDLMNSPLSCYPFEIKVLFDSDALQTVRSKNKTKEPPEEPSVVE